MKHFRISIGQASCKNNKSKNPLVRDICKLVLEKLESLKTLSYEQVSLFKDEETEFFHLRGKESFLTIYKEVFDEDIFIIVQIFHPTWMFPNYFSTTEVGKLYAEGLIYRKNGVVDSAPDSNLWNFR